jgi:hypothetical protein
MNRIEVLQHIVALRNGDPMIISPGLANYTIASGKDEPLTIYNMDMPYATPMALGVALGWPERRVIAVEGDCLRGRASYPPLAAINQKIW